MKEVCALLLPLNKVFSDKARQAAVEARRKKADKSFQDSLSSLGKNPPKTLAETAKAKSLPAATAVKGSTKTNSVKASLSAPNAKATAAAYDTRISAAKKEAQSLSDRATKAKMAGDMTAYKKLAKAAAAKVKKAASLSKEKGTAVAAAASYKPTTGGKVSGWSSK